MLEFFTYIFTDLWGPFCLYKQEIRNPVNCFSVYGVTGLATKDFVNKIQTERGFRKGFVWRYLW